MPKGKRAEKTPKPQASEENAEANIGHNQGPRELTDDERFALSVIHKRAYEKSLAAKKAADADLKNTCKLLKAELGANALADIKDMIALETPEGEAALKAEIERKIKVARWLGLPIGAQGSIFDEADRQPAVDKARAEGKRHGLSGDACSPPHDPSTPQYQSWIEGWQEGQTVLAGDFRQLVTAPETGNGDASDELDALDDAEKAQEERATAH